MHVTEEARGQDQRLTGLGCSRFDKLLVEESEKQNVEPSQNQHAEWLHQTFRAERQEAKASGRSSLFPFPSVTRLLAGHIRLSVMRQH